MNRTTKTKAKYMFIGLAIMTTIATLDAAYGYDKEYNQAVNNVIQEGLDQCADLTSNNCISVIATLDNICQVAYYPSCFGEQWTSYMNHLEELISNGHYPDKQYKEDSFLTLNNHHYGNDKL